MLEKRKYSLEGVTEPNRAKSTKEQCHHNRYPGTTMGNL